MTTTSTRRSGKAAATERRGRRRRHACVPRAIARVLAERMRWGVENFTDLEARTGVVIDLDTIPDRHPGPTP